MNVLVDGQEEFWLLFCTETHYIASTEFQEKFIIFRINESTRGTNNIGVYSDSLVTYERNSPWHDRLSMLISLRHHSLIKPGDSVLGWIGNTIYVSNQDSLGIYTFSDYSFTAEYRDGSTATPTCRKRG